MYVTWSLLWIPVVNNIDIWHIFFIQNWLWEGKKNLVDKLRNQLAANLLRCHISKKFIKNTTKPRQLYMRMDSINNDTQYCISNDLIIINWHFIKNEFINTYLREFEIIKLKSLYCPDYGDALFTKIGLVVTMIFSIQEYEYLMR